MDQRVRAVIDFMRANVNQRISVNDLASSVQLSPSHLRQLFNCETGKPVVRYLRDLRLDHAKELLETTFLSVKEIAARVGIHSVNHFVTAFKRAEGVTPSQFAARYRKAASSNSNQRIR